MNKRGVNDGLLLVLSLMIFMIALLIGVYFLFAENTTIIPSYATQFLVILFIVAILWIFYIFSSVKGGY